MKRIEIILTQSLEDDFIEMYNEACKDLGEKCKFTKLSGITGQGESIPKMGDAVWPQLNVMFIIFCSEELSKKVKDIIEKLHCEFIREGAAGFISEAEIL